MFSAHDGGYYRSIAQPTHRDYAASDDADTRRIISCDTPDEIAYKVTTRHRLS